MNKVEIVANLAEKTGLNKQDAEKAYDNLFDILIDALADGEKVGAIAINDKKDGSKKKIAPIYILPEFQNKGYGQLAMKEAERIHGESGWKLDTILEEKGNCHLYEKCGFVRVGEAHIINDKMTLIDYEKR